MDYLIMFKGVELSEEEKRVELMQRELFRAMVREAIERAEHANTAQGDEES